MMNTKNKIISVGDIAVDFLVQIPSFPVKGGDYILAEGMQIEPGGSANFLITAKRLGAEIHAVGVLGEDVWGDQVEGILLEEGIDIKFVERQGTSTQVIVLVGQDQKHSFIGKFGKGNTVQFNQYHKKLLENASALFFTGYSLNENRLQGLCFKLLEYAKQIGLKTYFDPGPSFEHLPEALQLMVIKSIDVLFVTENEIPFVNCNKIFDLFKYGPNLIIVKMGEKGCQVYQEDQEFFSPGFHAEVVDTTAAGDSFDAGFITAKINGLSLIEAAKYANAVGAVTVSRVGGGRNVPTLEEVKKMLE